MKKKKQEISVFDIKGQKKRFQMSRSSNKYNEKYMSVYKVEKYLYCVQNFKTGKINYKVKSNLLGSKSFKTLKEAREYRKEVFPPVLNKERTYVKNCKNIGTRTNRDGTIRHTVIVYIKKVRFAKSFTDINDALSFKDNLLKKKKMLSNFTEKRNRKAKRYNDATYTRTKASKHITKIFNKKSHHEAFVLYSKRLGIQKRFHSLQDAIDCREIKIKEYNARQDQELISA